jgi:hypothetical protein
MATKKRSKMARAKSSLPARTRTRTITKTSRARRVSKSSGGKFDLVQSLLMPAAGAGLGIIAGNAIAKMVPSLPYGKALVPFGLAFVTGSMLKQPGLAAGMAAAGGISLLQGISPTMFADEASSFIDQSPIPMITFEDATQDAYQAALISGQFNDASNYVVKYDAMGRAIACYPDGSMNYL